MDDEMITNRVKEALGSKMVFFVGAGISRDSGVPTFSELNEEVIRSIGGRELKEEECRLLSRDIRLRPEVVLQIGTEELGSGVVESLEMALGYSPNYNHIFLAEALRQGNWVFTTNFDNLIERACQQRGIRFKGCYRDDPRASHFRGFIQKYRLGRKPDFTNVEGGYLFKLHGTIEEEKQGKERFRTILVALNQVGRGLDKPKEQVLKYFLENYDFCFMGYSCQDDFSVFPVLLNIESKKRAFWFDYTKGSISELLWDKGKLQVQKEEELSKPPPERNWKIINVNSFLLSRDQAFKFIGNSSEYVRNRLCPLIGIASDIPIAEESTGSYDTFKRWAENIEGYKRGIFIGRLFEHIGHWDKAELYYKEALYIAEQRKNKEQLVTVKQRLADLYYRQDIWEKENKASQIYEGCIPIYESLGDDFKAADVKVDIANVKRRQGDYQGSKEWAEKAQRQLQQIYESIRDKEGEEYGKYKLGYARCLNVLGLAQLRGSEEELEKGLEHCQESRRIKDSEGDKSGVAESENAIALLLTAQGRQLLKENPELAARKFYEAIDHLEKAIDIRIRFGFYRGCAQHRRNIGDAYRELMTIEKEKEDFFQKAEANYKDGIYLWNFIKPKGPVGEILHYNQRLARLYADFVGIMSEKEERKKYNLEIISIYGNKILSDPEILQELKANNRELETARNVLERTKRSCEEMDLPAEVEEIGRLFEKLADQNMR